MNAEETLLQIAEEVIACTNCKLHHSRKNAVPGEGPEHADLMFIGEGPGFHENEQGRPFVGASGKFLEELLGTIGLKREDVFIGNVVKCRPPGNRDPLLDEIEACTAFLERQIKAINPKVIITLGRFSMARYFPEAKISQIHGQPMEIQGRLIVPMFHPAAALHQPSLRETVKEDFSKLPGLIEGGLSSSSPAELADNEPEQLNLF
ncbi:MAG: uracil-DNA glycosylase [Anaerolineales bacterium]|nr:MAG: uracil-DNA glycosylase [Anaerolineales bacterium]